MAQLIHTSASYFKNFEGVSRFRGPCVICGKDVKHGHTLIVDMETDEAITEAEAKDRYDVGTQPIGSDCLRNHPELKSYVID